MGGDSICALADRLGESELGSGPRLRKESVVGWRERREREEGKRKVRLLKSNSTGSMVTSACSALSRSSA